MPDLVIVLVIAAVIFGPRSLWRMRRRHHASRPAD
jgi:Sec-independent protein translocase protein TatA